MNGVERVRGKKIGSFGKNHWKLLWEKASYGRGLRRERRQRRNRVFLIVDFIGIQGDWGIELCLRENSKFLPGKGCRLRVDSYVMYRTVMYIVNLLKGLKSVLCIICGLILFIVLNSVLCRNGRVNGECRKCRGWLQFMRAKNVYKFPFLSSRIVSSRDHVVNLFQTSSSFSVLIYLV